MTQLVTILILFILMFSIASLGQEVERKYTLVEDNIEHAKNNLPLQVYTEDPVFTKQVHNLYIDCFFEKYGSQLCPDCRTNGS